MAEKRKGEEGEARTQARHGSSGARELAVGRLLRVEHGAAHVARLTGEAEADAARVASDLVAGVTRLRRRLDFFLDHFYRGDLDTLEPVLLQILRVGLYEALETRTPAPIAVSEAVNVAGQLLRRGAGGLVNGVLRAALRAAETGALPTPKMGDAAEDLAILHSHPTWMVRRWLGRLGEEGAVALLAANNARPAFGLRVNTLRTTPDEVAARLAELGVSFRSSRWLDDFFVVEQLQPVLRGGLVREGWCAVQDEAAGLVVRALDPQPGEAILDAAAAPGGKALYAAIRMGDTGRVVALDVHEAKVGLIRKAAEAHGLTSVEPVAGDLRTIAQEGAAYDRVLLDAPCSGLGVLARRADLRWRRTPDDLARLARLQGELLDAAARCVRPGGVLVYSTCSIEPEENEDRVSAFLARHPGFEAECITEVPEATRTPAGHYAAFPHVHGTDGAFAARLRRT